MNIILNIGLAFIEGFALIISPCILPILPIILSGSLTGKKSRPLGIIVGFILTFCFVTLFSRAIIELLHVSNQTLRTVSFLLLLAIGIVMMSTTLSESFTIFTQRLTRVGSSSRSATNTESGFMGGLLFGGLVGIIWTPCAGPILAAVLVQVVLQPTTFSSVLTILAFAMGAGFPMLLIALAGREIVGYFQFFRQHTVLLRKILGFIIILSVVYLYVSINNLSIASSYSREIPPSTTLTGAKLINKLEYPYVAPEISGIDAWLNSKPLTMASLQGKVVLIDFWTYSCINCLRTLPYLKSLYDKYHDQGFEIIGIHSPEFQFEHDLANVKRAVESNGIRYPVALDNNFSTWNNFNNQYWPAHYLIDKNGRVVYQHFGEGEYDVMENNIRNLLGLQMNTTIRRDEEQRYSTHQTPEIYLGYRRSANYAGAGAISQDAVADYAYPTTLPRDKWALQGKWIVNDEKIVSAKSGATIKLHFTSKKAYAVMGAPKKNITIKILFNGEPLTSDSQDVKNSMLLVSQQKLYVLFSKQEETDGEIELIVSDAGLEMYTFTFG